MISATRKASYAVVLVLFVAMASLHLAPVFLAGIFSYLILDVTYRFLARSLPRLAARWLALAVFLVSAVAIAWTFTHFVRQTLSTLPDIVSDALPKFTALAQRYGIELPFSDTSDLRGVAVQTIRENAEFITRASGVVTLRLFEILVSVFVAILCFFSCPPQHYGANLFDGLRREVNARLATFVDSFERILGAQILISLVNTMFTAAFLLFMGFPNAAFLIPATFILGMLPIVGNILSNTLIVGAGLTVTPRHAVMALAFLVVIHKGEYFLNSRIVGSSIRVPMWQTLLIILIGEAVMGVPGIILGPAVLHYVRAELSAIPLPPSREAA